MENSAIIIFFMLICVLAFDRVSSFTQKYEAIFNFGDSLSDTGNRLRTSNDHNFTGELPNGMTFGKHTGRSSDGRLVIDFIAEELGLQLLLPYLQLKNEPYVRKGVNFAVAGASALNPDILKEKMKPLDVTVYVNESLSVQLGWFKEWTSQCTLHEKDCKEYFKRSLFVVGFGGNDFNYPMMAKATDKQMEPLVPLVNEKISNAITELINQGAVSLLVPGVMHLSCDNTDKDSPTYVSHNKALQESLQKLRNSYPHVNITYADYYGASSVLYRNSKDYGFININEPCCPSDAEYNQCGAPNTKACANPSEYACWDGGHLTEAAYRIMANGLMHGNFTSSSLNHFGPLF